MKKKCYFVNERDENEGWSVVATSINEAKKLGYPLFEGSIDWIDMRVKLKKLDKSINLDDLPLGLIDFKKGLEIGAYSWIEDECPICKDDTLVYREDGKIGCHDCLYADEE